MCMPQWGVFVSADMLLISVIVWGAEIVVQVDESLFHHSPEVKQMQ